MFIILIYSFFFSLVYSLLTETKFKKITEINKIEKRRPCRTFERDVNPARQTSYINYSKKTYLSGKKSQKCLDIISLLTALLKASIVKVL